MNILVKILKLFNYNILSTLICDEINNLYEYETKENKYNKTKQLLLNYIQNEKYITYEILDYVYGQNIYLNFNNKRVFLFKEYVKKSNYLVSLFDTNKREIYLHVDYCDVLDNIFTYLIYNKNKVNNYLIYDNFHPIYLRDTDDFNNNLYYTMSYNQFISFMKYADIYEIDELKVKTSEMFDIISHHLDIYDFDKNTKLSTILKFFY
jgi:hypothetical protein